MIKELILAQQFCWACIPPPVTLPPPPSPPACPVASQLPTPHNCFQSMASYVVDGCSVPQQLAVATGTNRNNPVGGTVGLYSTAFGVDQGVVPSSAVGSISGLPCNQHDRCYKTCGMPRSVCDGNFGEGMRQVCGAAYPKPTPFYCPWRQGPYNDPVRCPKYDLEAVQCQTVSALMVTTVTFIGNSSYEQNQDRHCNCCNT